MSTTLWIILGVVLVFIGFVVYSYNKMKKTENVPNSKKIIVLNSKNFKSVVRNGIVLVDFWASWCAPCKIMAPILNEVAEMDIEGVKICKFNIEHSQDFANKFKIRSIPTIIVFKNGVEVKRIVGVKNKKTLVKEIEAVKN